MSALGDRPSDIELQRVLHIEDPGSDTDLDRRDQPGPRAAPLTLTPTNPVQHWVQARAAGLAGTMMTEGWHLAQENAVRTPLPLLVLVMFWLS